MRRIWLVTLVCMLSACGGGSGSDSVNTPAPTPPPPAPVEPPTAFAAARLLNQATYGPTRHDIEKVVELGLEGWIDAQLAMAPTYHRPKLEIIHAKLENPDELWRNHRLMAWWDRSLTAEDQLRQRMAYALSQLFVISEYSSFGHDIYAMTEYYDLLLKHAFNDYRTLLEAVTLSPVMGMYLSMLGNEKPDFERNIRPDENYAREVMQLFSIGLHELNSDGSLKLGAGNQPIPTYDQDDIEGLAHVFTGWHFNGTTEQDWWNWWENYDAISPMTAVQAYHDEQEKIIVGGEIITGGRSAEDDLDQALDALANHPNVGPFVAHRLIQRLVTSNPTSDYIARITAVFNNNGQGQRGDLAAVVKAILLDPEAREGHTTLPDQFGKLREPLLRVTHLWRAFDAFSTVDEFDFGYPDWALNQAPLAAPSVFNFYTADYAPPGPVLEQGLVAPEFQITTETYVMRTSNFLAYSTLWGNHEHANNGESRILVDLNYELNLLPNSEGILDHLDLMLLSGQMHDTTRQALLDYLEDTEGYPAIERVTDLIFLITNSPEYMVQR